MPPISSDASTKRQLLNKFRFRVSKAMKALAHQENGQAIYDQFFPSVLELEEAKGFSDDPLLEDHGDINPQDNIIHKYSNKVLFLVTSECPVFCRFCTRKRKTLMAPLASKATEADKQFLLRYLADHREINEVIFSGGDPFMLSGQELHELVSTISSLKQIRFLRFHTKTITTIPQKINTKFLIKLKEACQNKTASIVLHINHPLELTDHARLAIGRLKEFFKLYAQSVLLRNINDNQETLCQLFEELIGLDIQPYYLHQLDKISGGQHFYVPEDEGIKIMQAVRANLPPYMLPRYVRDSKQGKVNLFY